MPALVHCIYTSVEAHPFSEAEITQLVRESRMKNQQHGITGLLLHVEDTFFQILEGPAEAIRELYDKILLDSRHARITQIIFEPIARRYFGDSQMNVARLSPAELAGMLQEDSPKTLEHLLSGLDEGRAKRLLRAFADGRWRTHVGASPVAAVVSA